MRFCTATSTQLPETRKLAAALQRVHPGAPRLAGARHRPPRRGRAVRRPEPAALELPGWSEIVQDASLDELVDRVRPLLLRHLLRRHDEPVSCCSPRGSRCVGAARRPGGRPRPRGDRARPAGSRGPAGRRPDPGRDRDRLLGPVRPGLSRACARARTLRPSSAGGRNAPPRVTGPGPTLGNILAAFTDLVAVVDDRGVDVSGWNLHARPLSRAADGALLPRAGRSSSSTSRGSAPTAPTGSATTSRASGCSTTRC